MIRLVARNDRRKPPWVMDIHAQLVQWIQLTPPGPLSSPVVFAGPSPLAPTDQPPHSMPYRKYRLQMRLDLGNPNQFPIALDAIVFRFQRLDGGSSLEDVIEQVTIWGDDEKLVTRFFYDPGAAAASQPDEEPRRITIARRRGLILPSVPLGGERSVSNEHGPTRISGHVYCEGREVAYPVTAELPPRSAIPVVEAPHRDESGLPIFFVRKASSD